MSLRDLVQIWCSILPVVGHKSPLPWIEARTHTLAELIDRYIKSELPKKPKSEDKQKAQLEWWKQQIGYKTLQDITASVLVECKGQLLQGITYRGTIRSAATANRYMAALSHVFSKAFKEWGWMESNPLSKVSKEKESKGRVRFLSDDERGRLLETCKGSLNQHPYLIVMLALSTGARQSEYGLVAGNLSAQIGVCRRDNTQAGVAGILQLQEQGDDLFVCPAEAPHYIVSAPDADHRCHQCGTQKYQIAH